MPHRSVHEQVSEQFAELERRGRGWQVFPEPVTPEPPFVPFTGYTLASVLDDGRVPTVGSSLLSGVLRWLNKEPQVPSNEDEAEEPVPTPLVREDLVELQLSLPDSLKVSPEVFAGFLSQLTLCTEPVSFELFGTTEKVVAQFSASHSDAPGVRRQLSAHFPEVVFLPTKDTLFPLAEPDAHHAVVEFGLEKEFLLPLASGGLDPFVALVAAMGELREGDCALYQVLFQPCRHPWRENILRSVTDGEGGALFVNRPDLVMLAKGKVSQPLHAVVVRITSKSGSFEEAWEILRGLARALRVFSNPEGNELVPLANDDYPAEAHLEDVLRRQTRRSGMLLNADELAGFVHLPSPAVRTARFQRQSKTSKAPPKSLSPVGVLLGTNLHAGKTTPVRLSAEQRTRHMHVIGASGTGKSTFLFNLIQQDILAGEGLAVLDPHGDLIDRILEVIPEHRIKDVILVDPSDETASIGFNILSAHSDLEKTLLASDLVSVFARLSTSWGDQMEGVFRNAILAFLESSQGGTLSDLRRFLLDPKYRERFLATVQDPDIQFYWRKGFAQLTGNKSIGPVLTRLEIFLAPKPIRYMVAQPVNRLDFTGILDSGKILLAKLSQGAIGKENSHLLGSLFMAKLQQAVMARQRQEAAVRQDFWLYCDEFHNFITPSMAEILSGARKYRLGLVLAHQELRQLERDREVASAVLSNPYTRVVFRVGDDDARKLENGFSSFEAHDLQNLATGEAVVRIERSDGDFNLRVSQPEKVDPALAAARLKEVTEASRRTYATPRAEIEAALRQQFPPEEPPQSAEARKDAEEFRAVPKASERIGKVPKMAESSGIVPQVAEAPKTSEPGADSKAALETEHSAIKRQITRHAEALGYHVAVEEFVADTLGRADLVLRRGKRVVAVEVSVTTNAGNEIGNLVKCLSGDFSQVVLVATSARKLANIERRFRSTAPAEGAAEVVFCLPADLLEQLRTWAAGDPRDLATEKAFPRKQPINLVAPRMTDAERTEREGAMLARLREAMKTPPPT